MGSYFSKVGSDSFYLSFEKTFTRLTAETDRLKKQQQVRRQQQQHLSRLLIGWGTALWVIAVAYAAWVLRQPPGTFTPSEHALRVAPVLVEPLVGFLVLQSLGWLLRMRDKRIHRRLKTSQTRLRKMISELKDSTHYQKTQQLLEKYDPDYVPPTPRRQSPMRQRPGSGAQQQQQQSLPGIPKHMQQQQQQQQGNAGLLSPFTGLQRGVGAAGSRVVPLLGHLANLVGDNPELLDGLREARAEAEALRSRLAVALEENRQLKARLGEPVIAPAGEPEGVQTPLSGRYQQPPTDSFTTSRDLHAELAAAQPAQEEDESHSKPDQAPQEDHDKENMHSSDMHSSDNVSAKPVAQQVQAAAAVPLPPDTGSTNPKAVKIK